METVLRQAKRMRKTFQLMENKLLESPVYILDTLNKLPNNQTGIYFISTKDNWTHLGGKLDDDDILYVGKTKTNFRSRLSKNHDVIIHCKKVNKNIEIRFSFSNI